MWTRGSRLRRAEPTRLRPVACGWRGKARPASAARPSHTVRFRAPDDKSLGTEETFIAFRVLSPSCSMSRGSATPRHAHRINGVALHLVEDILASPRKAPRERCGTHAHPQNHHGHRHQYPLLPWGGVRQHAVLF